MVDRIDDETERRGTDDTQIKQCINDAIVFYRAQRFWFLEGPSAAALTSLTTIGNSYVARYTGLITLDSLRITISGQLLPMEQVSFETMEQYHDGSSNNGQPWAFCLHADRVRLYPTPGEVYTLTWSGTFEETVALSADADTNDWMTHGEQLIRFRAKKCYMRDILRDRPEEVLFAQSAEDEALMMLKSETTKRQGTRRIKARM